MSLFETLVSVGLTALVSAVSYLISKVITGDKIMTAHIASDEQVFERIFESIKDFKDAVRRDTADMKDELKAQTVKLDRLIEQNLNRATDAMVARGAVSAAAATALDVVENAKVSALAIIAHAASEAKKRT